MYGIRLLNGIVVGHVSLAAALDKYRGWTVVTAIVYRADDRIVKLKW